MSYTLKIGCKGNRYTFFWCSNSKYPMSFNKLILPSSLTKIGPFTFQYCTKIPELTLPEGLEVISDGAFDHMTGLENTSLTIPSTVKTIGGDYLADENTATVVTFSTIWEKLKLSKLYNTASGNK